MTTVTMNAYVEALQRQARGRQLDLSKIPPAKRAELERRGIRLEDADGLYKGQVRAQSAEPGIRVDSFISPQEAFWLIETKDSNGAWGSFDDGNTAVRGAVEALAELFTTEAYLGLPPQATQPQPAPPAQDVVDPGAHRPQPPGGPAPRAQAPGVLELRGMTRAEADAAIEQLGLDPERPWRPSGHTVDTQAMNRDFHVPLEVIDGVAEMMTQASGLEGAQAEAFKARAKQQVAQKAQMTEPIQAFSKLVPIGKELKWVPNVTAAKRSEDVNVIPYNNDWGYDQRPILENAAVGEVLFGVSNHNAEHRVLGAGKETIKQDMTHARMYIVVDRDPDPDRVEKGLVAIDYPRSYAYTNYTEFDNQTPSHVNPTRYPSTLYKLELPAHLSLGEKRAVMDNIRTWAMLVQKLAHFPQDYNGADNLGTHDIPSIKKFGEQTLRALGGDRAAISWVKSNAANMIYCAEGAEWLAVNLGQAVPLNQASLTALDPSGALWRIAQQIVADGSEKFWTTRYPDYYTEAYDPSGRGATAPNAEFARQVPLQLAPEWLDPVYLGVPEPSRQRGGVAFQPWDMSGIIRAWLRKSVPRRDLARRQFVSDAAYQQALAEHADAQAKLFMSTQPDLMKTLNVGTDQAKIAAVQQLYQQLAAEIARPREYAEMLQAIDGMLQQPDTRRLMMETGAATSAADRNGDTLFVPPNRAAHQEPGDLFRFREVGQLLHEKYTRPR